MQELPEYEVKPSPQANDTYGAFVVGKHDDMVTALGLAVQDDIRVGGQPVTLPFAEIERHRALRGAPDMRIVPGVNHVPGAHPWGNMLGDTPIHEQRGFPRRRQ